MEIKIGFNFLTIMEDWKSPDVSAAGMISRNNQKVNETKNLNGYFDASESPINKLEVEAKQEIKEESMDEDFMEQNSEEDDPLPITL